MYEHQLNLKKTEEAEQALLQNNSEDVRLSDNKVSHECGTQRSKAWPLKTNLKASTKIKIKGKSSVERK